MDPKTPCMVNDCQDLTVARCKRVPLEGHLSKGGELLALEGLQNVPFEIKRMYYVHHMDPTFRRGDHAYKRLQQLYYCFAGSCAFLLDDGTHRLNVVLNNPHMGLLIGNYVWRETFDFSPDCVLVALASEHYDPQDYIRSYDEFLELVQHAFPKNSVL